MADEGSAALREALSSTVGITRARSNSGARRVHAGLGGSLFEEVSGHKNATHGWAARQDPGPRLTLASAIITPACGYSWRCARLPPVPAPPAMAAYTSRTDPASPSSNH